MENENNNEEFSFKYSAKEQEELKKIREKYISPEDTKEGKMEQIRALDRNVTRKGTVVSLILGVLGTLILGMGMSLLMTELGNALGDSALPVGISVGIVGIVLIALAYPVFVQITKMERKRIAPEIIRLTDELIK